MPVVATQATGETEVLGVNSPVQLADLERRFQREQAERLMEAGVRLMDPARDLRHAASPAAMSPSMSTASSRARSSWATMCRSAPTA